MSTMVLAISITTGVAVWLVAQVVAVACQVDTPLQNGWKSYSAADLSS